MSFNKNLFDKNFPFAFKATVSNAFLIATKVFEDFWRENSTFLCSADELYGRILSYSVNQHFKQESSKTAPVYLVTDSITSNYRNNAVFLNTADYITSICRTNKPNQLPSKAKYKLELAKGNQSQNNQMRLECVANDLHITDMKKYAVIGYRYEQSEMKHLNIMVPDSDFSGILHYEDLLGNVTEYKKYIPQELIEEQVSTLKDELIVKLKDTNI